MMMIPGETAIQGFSEATETITDRARDPDLPLPGGSRPDARRGERTREETEETSARNEKAVTRSKSDKRRRIKSQRLRRRHSP